MVGSEGIEAISDEGEIGMIPKCLRNMMYYERNKKQYEFAETVNVVPQPKAGGSLATAAYHGFTHPVVVEEIKADAGIDIGSTFLQCRKRIAGNFPNNIHNVINTIILVILLICMIST